MDNDYSGAAAGLGVGLFILFGVIYLGILALAIWIGYLIQRTAVKNGVLLAMKESGTQFPPSYRPGAQPPYPGGLGQPGGPTHGGPTPGGPTHGGPTPPPASGPAAPSA
ncbi:hypothetical protein [Microbacterium sp.]|uniref:hypothetical protein n=1 Tax=Microbacterium sp. TaxID=51671 RepID=UPI0037355333